MKKFATVLTAAVMLFTASAFASDGDKVNVRIKESFRTDFSAATEVNWEKSYDFYFASFKLNNVSTEAAYNEEGELLGTSRKIAFSQVPLGITMQIGKLYRDFTLVGQAIEVNFEGQTRYYLTLENNKQVIGLKCTGNGELSVESRKKK
jgi:hypothetical protein